MAERPVSESTDRPPGKATDERRSAGGDLLALPAGYAINEYRIDRVLGCGGFGITYLAHDTHLDCPVAIKEYLPRELAGRDSGLSVRAHSDASARSFEWGLERFLLECRALASFHHPGIVRVLRYFRANDTAYMVMEYERGEPLDQWRAGQPALDSATLLRIVRPLLDGLETIHNTGFLHRDIKPRNIYIRADGSPVLLDFGAARRLGSAGQEHLLTAVVTPGFAPAEQYQPDGKQGPWTDLYALAGVMYWLVTGRLPTESLARLREDPMPAASAIGKPEVFGKAMLRAIDWALTPDENQRPLRVADFRRACLPATTQPPAGISLAEGCSFIGAVLFADVTSANSPDEAAHQEQRGLLATIVSQAVATVPASSRLAANTREGCAVCYVGDPEDALRTAALLGASASERGLGLQIGINLGPVLVQPAPSGRSRLLGDGVATACRVMRLSEPGQVLVTRAYVELIAQLGRSASACFSRLGQRRDPQDREHDLYHYTGDSQTAAPSHPGSPGVPPGVPPGMPFSDADLDRIGKLFARYIGPMSKVLLRREAGQGGDLEVLCRALARHIDSAEQRQHFLREAGVG